MYRPGKAAYGNSVSRVRIPPLPPDFERQKASVFCLFSFPAASFHIPQRLLGRASRHIKLPQASSRIHQADTEASNPIPRLMHIRRPGASGPLFVEGINCENQNRDRCRFRSASLSSRRRPGRCRPDLPGRPGPLHDEFALRLQGRARQERRPQ